jgi:hypothetical protein
MCRLFYTVAFLLACSSIASAQCANGQCGMPSNGFRPFANARQVFSRPMYMPQQQVYYTSQPQVIEYAQPAQVVYTRPVSTVWRPRFRRVR